MITPQQPPFISQQCPTGSEEAERLFQLGVDYHSGRKGMPTDLKKAERLYKEALEMGNAKAAINIGVMYHRDYSEEPNPKEREQFGFQMYEKAANMGCPEGIYAIASAYSRGWGVSADQNKALELIKLAAEKGCLNAMVEYGMMRFDAGKEQEGIAWLEKSLALGNGDAATNLSLLYEQQGKIEDLIRVVRRGSQLGSRTAFVDLMMVYDMGLYGQDKNLEYAKKLSSYLKAMDKREAPRFIPNFDELFPPQPILPYKR